MKILTLLKRGIHHKNFNEDFLYTSSLTKDITVCAVMDGCSSAKDSQFTSSLYAKSIHKSTRMLPQMKEIIEDFDLETMGLEGIADFIMKQLFDDLKRTKKLFFLETEELLSTIVLLIYDNKKKTACIKMSGDGLFSVNNEVTEIDQNNIPNFLGYHLKMGFEKVKNSEIETWIFNDVIDVSISTDGIDKLRPKFSSKKEEIFVPRRSLILEAPKKQEGNFLESQYQTFIENRFVPLDDICIIRVINDD